MNVDAHQHFWRYDPAEYDWIDDSMAALRRDFLPTDLADQMKETGIEGVVSVQARQSMEETRWLLQMADQYAFVCGVVGWVPLADPAVEVHLGEFAMNEILKGVRHVVQCEPDDFLFREDFNRGIGLLAARGLIYDVLIYQNQLPQAIAFVDRHPNQFFVLDHIAKPLIRDETVEPWRTHIMELARREHVCCKLSGLVFEADWNNWTVDSLRPYFDVVLQAFGPQRLMFGSDWPVCLVGSSYARWYDVVSELASSLTGDERQRLFGGTACDVYQL